MLDRIVNGISGIAESIGDLASNITDGIKQVLIDIFVPSEDYVSNRWQSIRDRFSFADSISETAQIISRFFIETNFDIPPTIKVDFGYAESKYDWGGETFCLDMSWYARYKPIVDPFLSAWIWLIFIWRLFNNLPNIINGVPGDFEMINKTNESKDYIKWSLSGGKKGGKK